MIPTREARLDKQGSPERRRRTLLIVEDNHVLRQHMCRAMERRGFNVFLAQDIQEAQEVLRQAEQISHVLLDLRLGEENGLVLLEEIKARYPKARILVVTGYGNIATAVAAIKAGAVDYLPKPADADQIYSALVGDDKQDVPNLPDTFMNPDRLRWEYILRVYQDCGENVSLTARRLKMHRRTLQRILAKHAPHQ